MEGASVPQTDDPKPDEPQGVKRADAELAHAYEQIKSAEEELARLDRQVLGMEYSGDGSRIRPRATGAEPADATVNATKASENTSEKKTWENKVPRRDVRRGQPMLLGLLGFLLAICIVGAAFASRYGNEAKAIMARWAPPAPIASPIAPPEASKPPGPTQSLMAQAADTGQQPAPPEVPSQKEVKSAPSTGAATSAERTSADPGQSLATIAHDLTSINEKLDQLKSSYDQRIREQADAVQQLKKAQEQSTGDNARIAGQVQALQAQLSALSAKSPAPAAAPSLKKETDVAPRQRQSVVAAPPRPRRPPPWRPPPYMDERWDDGYW
jgi:hypothetical protein